MRGLRRATWLPVGGASTAGPRRREHSRRPRRRRGCRSCPTPRPAMCSARPSGRVSPAVPQPGLLQFRLGVRILLGRAETLGHAAIAPYAPEPQRLFRRRRLGLMDLDSHGRRPLLCRPWRIVGGSARAGFGTTILVYHSGLHGGRDKMISSGGPQLGRQGSSLRGPARHHLGLAHRLDRAQSPGRCHRDQPRLETGCSSTW